MTYFIIEKVPNRYNIKRIDTEQGVLNYVRPILDKPDELKNLTIIEGDELEIVTKLRIKDIDR